MSRIRHWLEPRILGVILAAASALWVFIGVAEEVAEGEAHSVDAAILLALRTVDDLADPLGPRWLEEFARDVTALGSPGVLAMLVAVVALFLLLAGSRRTSLFLLLATGSGAFAAALLKQGFDRPRPDLVPHATYVVSASFPSAHAMVSAVVYLTLGALVARMVHRRRLKLYVIMVAASLAGLIGVSRVYLGVHWPTDVLAGWAAGAAWALACWVAAQRGLVDEGTGR